MAFCPNSPPTSVAVDLPETVNVTSPTFRGWFKPANVTSSVVSSVVVSAAFSSEAVSFSSALGSVDAGSAVSSSPPVVATPMMITASSHTHHFL